MGQTSRFDLENALQVWESDLKVSEIYTNSDLLEIKSHLLDIYDNLLKNGVDEDLAFYTAVKRIGGPMDWESEFKSVNNPLIQTRKTILFIAGIIFYYGTYYLAIDVSKVVAIIGVELNIENPIIIRVITLFLILVLLIVILFFNAMIIKEKFLLRFLEKINFRLKHVYLLVISTIVLALLERALTPFLNKHFPDPFYRYNIFERQLFFGYAYLILLGVGFIVLFIRYNRQAKPQSN